MKNHILGCLFGLAVGDSIGLPSEGLSRQKLAERFPNDLQQRFIFRRGMFSDDTEHTLMVAAALGKNPNDPEAFQLSLAWKFKWWLLALPGGVGLATGRAIIKLWLGFPPEKAGVYSAGNGPAMRSPIIGVFFATDSEKRMAFTKASAQLTHTDPRAIEAAILVAESAALSAKKIPDEAIITTLRAYITSKEMNFRFQILEEALFVQRSTHEYAAAIDCKKAVSGFAPDSVAVAIYSWLRYRNDFRKIITEIIHCGGDTDTTAAIAGGIAGAECDLNEMPESWREDIIDFPRSKTYLYKLAAYLENPEKYSKPLLAWWAIPFRNILFLVIVIAHGLRRLFP